MTQPAVTELDRTPVADYRTYAEAQRAVDFLSDSHFPVEKTSIIGSDLRMVENVIGRLTRGRAALAGAGSGAWFGLLFGLLISLFANGTGNTFAVVLECLLIGLAFGAVFGFVAHAATGGRRDFTSRSAIVAHRYEVQVDSDVAEDAKNLLIKLAWRTS
jgi:hypothetical protein